MRIYPPVHTIAREAIGEDTLVGQRVPKGSTVLIVPWLLHRHAKLWDNPGQFDPGEVLAGSDPKPGSALLICRLAAESASASGRLSRLPRRRCLLATLAQRYRLRLVPGHPVEPQGLITLRARHGMQMILEARSPSAA